VFRISGKDGTASLVSKSLSPNGIACRRSQEAVVTNALLDGFPRQRDGTTARQSFVNPKQ